MIFSPGLTYAQETGPAENCPNFKACDKNQDNFINQNECRYTSFQQFDKNKDGKLSRKEHKKLLKYETKMKASNQYNQQQQNQQQKMNRKTQVNQKQRSNKHQDKRGG
jgi:Ca2+-binding EF-hand superfamily protein